jgi:hypothetical protein
MTAVDSIVRFLQRMVGMLPGTAGGGALGLRPAGGKHLPSQALALNMLPNLFGGYIGPPVTVNHFKLAGSVGSNSRGSVGKAGSSGCRSTLNPKR